MSDDAELAVITGQRDVSIRWADIEVGEALVLELIELVQRPDAIEVVDADQPPTIASTSSA